MQEPPPTESPNAWVGFESLFNSGHGRRSAYCSPTPSLGFDRQGVGGINPASTPECDLWHLVGGHLGLCVPEVFPVCHSGAVEVGVVCGGGFSQLQEVMRLNTPQRNRMLTSPTLLRI